MRITTGILVASIVGACATPFYPDDSRNVVAVIQASAGVGFDIGVGQEAAVQGTPIAIRFVGVGEDSRCPADVQCVWAGDAAVRLVISAPGTAGTEVALHTTLEPKSAVFAGHAVRLTDLRPVPRSGTSIPATRYVATLEVRAVSGP